MLSLPQGVIMILGSLEALLPVPDAPVLELRMDSLGVIDFAGGTVLVTASLYDSRLLGVIELSGDMALYMSVLNDPYFVLSIGGFHPGYDPPAQRPGRPRGPARDARRDRRSARRSRGAHRPTSRPPPTASSSAAGSTSRRPSSSCS